jgi:hypothetical protein
MEYLQTRLLNCANAISQDDLLENNATVIIPQTVGN